MNIIKYNGIDTLDYAVDMANAIHKVCPDLLFKHEDFQKYGVDLNLYPQGFGYNFFVFHKSDPNNHIGKLAVEQWGSKTPKYCIQSININDGRRTWGSEGEYKTSIHLKNIVRVAKKVFKPYTFGQIAKRSSQTFKNHIEKLANDMRWELRTKTCDGYQHLIQDFENLYHLGYTPKNEKFARMMEFVVNNKEKIDKYKDYNPAHYFVLVQQDSVQYCLNTAKDFGEPFSVPNKDALPEDIKGKLFVLDISDKQDFVEDVGLKENDGAYWIIA